MWVLSIFYLHKQWISIFSTRQTYIMQMISVFLKLGLLQANTMFKTQCSTQNPVLDSTLPPIRLITQPSFNTMRCLLLHMSWHFTMWKAASQLLLTDTEQWQSHLSNWITQLRRVRSKRGALLMSAEVTEHPGAASNAAVTCRLG